ncbi:MAG: tripartite tricarboxylate transporter substrate binding protein [Burkholderiales bacterium]|nr:tripartite tricarboxylate transporter substrate binding protein [Burkholderiales bacterium]
MFRLLCACFTAPLLAAPGVLAQAYPTKPIRLLVGFAPGGAADILGRLSAQALSDGIGEQVVVDNRPGAGSLIATEIAARANADGYTLLFTSPPHAINRALYRKAKYDPVADFDPVVQAVATALVLTVNPASPFKSVRELVSYAKSNPGKLSYGSGGSGASGHLAMELFKSVTATDIVHIPYKGTGPVITDLIGGQIHMTIGSAAPTLPQVKAGKLRALAVTSKHRSIVLPDVPTVAESGFPAYEVTQWFGILAPRGTPAAVIDKVNAAMQLALQRKEVRERFLASSAEPVGGTPQAFRALIVEEVAKWGKLVRTLDLKAD